MNKQNAPSLVRRREMLLRTTSLISLVGVSGIFKQSALAHQAKTTVLTPQEVEGPYFVDEKLNRSDIISDPSDDSIQPGLPLMLAISVSQLSDDKVAPLPNAYVDLWQANASGVYSDEAAQNTVGQKFLRGYQVTDRRGCVRFLTIYPGWYSGRTAHIHCRIRLYSDQTTTYSFETQFFMDDSITQTVYENFAPYNSRASGRDTYNNTDGIYSNVDCTTGGISGEELTLRLALKSSRAVASYNLLLDLNAAAPTCTGVSNGGVNAGASGGGAPSSGTPPTGTPPAGTPPSGTTPA